VTPAPDRPVVVVDADVLGRRRTGDETYVRGLLGALASAPRSFTVTAATRGPEHVPEGIGTVATGGRGQVHRLLRGLPAALERAGADLVHGNYFLPRGWKGKAVVTVHDVSFARDRGFMPLHDLLAFRTLVPRAMRRADFVFTVSEWAKADLIDCYGLSPDRVVVTPNGIDDDLTPEGAVPDRPPYLLFVGGLQRRKDPVTAVRALAQVPDDLELVIVGPDRGEGPAVRRAAEELGIADRVHVLDYVSREELLGLYRGAVALVFPSRYEGFGLPVLEAMASGTPVVAAATTAIPEVVGDAGILVPPGDPEALAAGIAQARESTDALVAAGLARAGEQSWSLAADRAAAAYEAALAR
jgi:glycosyltransferase involved in cell wall biosynthesis